METPKRFTPERIHPIFLTAIEKLREIQPIYGNAVATMRMAIGIKNRGCGPSAFGLAVFLQEHLENVPISASVTAESTSAEGINIIYGIQQENGKWIDHAWIETNKLGQTLVVSPISNDRNAQASFMATVINTDMLSSAYPEMGLKRIKSLVSDLKFNKFVVREIQEVINQINEGSIPENYKYWVENLLTAIS